MAYKIVSSPTQTSLFQQIDGIPFACLELAIMPDDNELVMFSAQPLGDCFFISCMILGHIYDIDVLKGTPQDIRDRIAAQLIMDSGNVANVLESSIVSAVSGDSEALSDNLGIPSQVIQTIGEIFTGIQSGHVGEHLEEWRNQAVQIYSDAIRSEAWASYPELLAASKLSRRAVFVAGKTPRGLNLHYYRFGGFVPRDFSEVIRTEGSVGSVNPEKDIFDFLVNEGILGSDGQFLKRPDNREIARLARLPEKPPFMNMEQLRQVLGRQHVVENKTPLLLISSGMHFDPAVILDSETLAQINRHADQIQPHLVNFSIVKPRFPVCVGPAASESSAAEPPEAEQIPAETPPPPTQDEQRLGADAPDEEWPTWDTPKEKKKTEIQVFFDSLDSGHPAKSMVDAIQAERDLFSTLCGGYYSPQPFNILVKHWVNLVLPMTKVEWGAGQNPPDDLVHKLTADLFSQVQRHEEGFGYHVIFDCFGEHHSLMEELNSYLGGGNGSPFLWEHQLNQTVDPTESRDDEDWEAIKQVVDGLTEPKDIQLGCLLVTCQWLADQTLMPVDDDSEILPILGRLIWVIAEAYRLSDGVEGPVLNQILKIGSEMFDEEADDMGFD